MSGSAKREYPWVRMHCRSPPRKKESRRTVAWHDDDDYLVALSRVDSPPESPDLDQKEEPPAPTEPLLDERAVRDAKRINGVFPADVVSYYLYC